MTRRRGFDDRETAAAAGRKGAATLKAQQGVEHFAALGRAGGTANRDRHGEDHFRERGRRGALARWARVRAAKEQAL
jgi:hypothetical protein